MKPFFLLAIIALVLVCPIQAQFVDSLAPEIGKLCPDFKLTGVEYYSKTEITRDDLKGKWFVLDLWSRGCEGCIEALPKLNNLQQEMNGKVQVILVGLADSLIRPLYEKLRKYRSLNLPIVYNKELFEEYGAHSLPYQLVADDKGIVRAVTFGINRLRLDSMMAGMSTESIPAFAYQQLHQKQILFDCYKPFLVNGNGGEDSVFLYRSMLSRWKPGMDIHSSELIGSHRWDRFLKNGIQDISIPVAFLYKIAYHGKLFTFPNDSLYGRIWPFLVLKLRDSSLFKFDGTRGINMFNYSLIVPKEKATTDYLQKMMRRDLKSYFGYRVVSEQKMMPCWRLVANPLSRKMLKTSGIEGNPNQVMQPIATGFSFTNVPVLQLINEIYNLYQAEPVLDETGISGNIDISVEGDMTDFNKMRKALQGKGLDLLPGKKMMTVTTIYDPVDEDL